MVENKWYIFKRNDDQEYVKLRKTFESRREAYNYAIDHNYQNAMISNNAELYMNKEYYSGARS